MNKTLVKILKDSELLKDYLYELDEYKKRTKKPRKPRNKNILKKK